MIKGANYGEGGNTFYSVAYASILTAAASSKSDVGTVLMDTPVIEVNGVESRHIYFIGSCNGLLCLGATYIPTVILWNPSTNEYKKIILPEDVFISTGCYGFGFDSKVNDYKLVGITRDEVHALALKSNSWSRFNTITHGYNPSELVGLLLNGVLHWSVAASSGEKHKFVLCFDISSEKFINWPFPEAIIERPKDSYVMLRVWGESLCLVCGIDDVRVDVWVMQTYGVKETWVKKFTTTQVDITSYCALSQLHWSIKDEEILIQERKEFILYDAKNDRVMSLYFNGVNGRFDNLILESYVESMVSLNSGTYTCRDLQVVISVEVNGLVAAAVECQMLRKEHLGFCAPRIGGADVAKGELREGLGDAWGCS
ncbi:F-box/kelch-repeat protein At3g06240-like [Papaver somniferum]|uniref:F-box/kelch-repeat protein At3g06240-like n=1 Tax=Papaver somniferum TaxID=3469 RepID=UPI000E6FA453|nr:F-box/kelch-repeat protein At3g06240-like [Papaver somniferum]